MCHELPTRSLANGIWRSSLVVVGIMKRGMKRGWSGGWGRWRLRDKPGCSIAHRRQPRVQIERLGEDGRMHTSQALARAVAADPAVARHASVMVTAKPEAMFSPALRELIAAVRLGLVAKPFDLDVLLAAARQAELQVAAC